MLPSNWGEAWGRFLCFQLGTFFRPSHQLLNYFESQQIDANRMQFFGHLANINRSTQMIQLNTGKQIAA